MEDLKKVSHFKKFNVNSYETDRNQDLKINSVFQWFSEIAWEHAKQVNLGFEDLNETDYFWVLLGMNVKINNLPKWQDELTVQTWPSGISGLYYTREFIIYDKDENVLVSASSLWLIYNRATSRPVVPSGERANYRMHPHRATDQEFKKLPKHKNLDSHFKITARYTDIDMHMHVNNAVYIKWIENFLGDLNPKKIRAIKIQYLKEVKLDSEITVSFGKDGDIYCFEAVNNEDDKTCFRAEVEVY